MQQGRIPDLPIIEDVLSDCYAARKAALGMCADLARDIVNGLTDNSEWRLDVLDEYGKPVFRLRLLAELLEAPGLTESGAVDAPQEELGLGDGP